jgi:ankyrin repeat protein
MSSQIIFKNNPYFPDHLGFNEFMKSHLNDARPLHVLVQNVYKYPEILEYLKDHLKEYAHAINLTDANGWTPLHHLCLLSYHKPCVDLLQLLLEFRPQPFLFIQDREGLTPLHLAAFTAINEYGLKAIELLLMHNGNVSSQSKKGNTPLHILINTIMPFDGTCIKPDYNGDCDCIKSPSFDIKIKLVKMFIEAGTNLFLQNNDGNTVLHLLGERCKLAKIKKILVLLIDKNILFLNLTNNQGKTPEDYFDYDLNYRLTLKMFEKLKREECQQITIQVITSKL